LNQSVAKGEGRNRSLKRNMHYTPFPHPRRLFEIADKCGGSQSEWEVRLEEEPAMPKTTDYAVKTPAERMRCYRHRQRRQWRSVRIEIAAAEIDALVKRRYLDPKNRDDQTAIGEAATAFISDALFGM
jgi:hypothetical protein